MAFSLCIMKAIFYIMYSNEADKFYIGHTTQTIEERFARHLSNHDGFTAKYKDWKVVYTEEYPTKELAYQRGRQVKAWKSKKKIQTLLRG
jgi:putative endonuclease